MAWKVQQGSNSKAVCYEWWRVNGNWDKKSVYWPLTTMKKGLKIQRFVKGLLPSLNIYIYIYMHVHHDTFSVYLVMFCKIVMKSLSINMSVWSVLLLRLFIWPCFLCLVSAPVSSLDVLVMSLSFLPAFNSCPHRISLCIKTCVSSHIRP